MNFTNNSLLFVVLVLGTAISGSQSRADPSFGRLLYETHCSGCHNKSVHNRKRRVAQSYSEVHDQVQRWSIYVGAGWSKRNITDVANYLNSQFYQFECLEKQCDKAGVQNDSDLTIGAR